MEREKSHNKKKADFVFSSVRAPEEEKCLRSTNSDKLFTVPEKTDIYHVFSELRSPKVIIICL